MTRIQRFISSASQATPTLWMHGLFMFVIFSFGVLLPFIDAREFHGVSVWEKPSKFFLSLAVQFVTIAWALSLISPEERNSRGVKVAIVAMMAAGWLELLIITYRAALGEASHFNTATAFDGALYSIMGAGALTLTATAFYIGWKVFRRVELWREATGLGLMLGAVLATLTAGYMSSLSGHHVGGELSDANGLGFFHWSTTGGDLRVPHFIGLHALQFVPLSAMFAKRYIVYASAAVITIATAFTFVQAYLGIPLFAA